MHLNHRLRRLISCFEWIAYPGLYELLALAVFLVSSHVHGRGSKGLMLLPGPFKRVTYPGCQPPLTRYRP